MSVVSFQSSKAPSKSPTSRPTNKPTLFVVEEDTMYEAEDYGGSGVTVKITHAGFTGDGFLDYGGAGTYVQFDNVDGGMGGSCTLKIRYANGGTWTRRCKVNVNGVDQPGEIAFPPTGAWNSWLDTEPIEVNCEPGNANTIQIIGLTSGPNMDHMEVMTLIETTPKVRMKRYFDRYLVRS